MFRLVPKRVYPVQQLNQPPRDVPVKTFSIITTDSNPLTDYIHNTKHRMPAILASKDEKRWLDPKLTKADIEELLRPFPAEQMDANMNNNNSQSEFFINY